MPTPTRWVAIQRNPLSGSGRRRPLLEFMASLRRRGLRPRLYSDRGRLDRALSNPELRPMLHGVVAAGGDGTVLDLINRHPGVPVGILPLGTENLLARQFRIPRDGAGAAAVVAHGRLQPLDLGRIGARRFAIMASFGFDAEVIHRAHARRSGHITRMHYFQPICSALRSYKYPEIRVFADDGPQPVAGKLVIVANLPAYALRLGLAPTARGDDGLLDVRVFQRGSTFDMLRYVWLVAMGRHETLPDVTSLRVRRIRLDSYVPIPVQADGDPAGYTPSEITVEPAAAQLFVPD
jgi:diacylglycerol kinase family enzyme